MSRLLAVLLLACLALLGCQQEAAEVSPEAQVEAALKAHVAGKSSLDLSNMDMEVTEVAVEGDMARAVVLFRTKGGEAEMPVRYSLTRQNGSWVVQDTGQRRVHGQQLPQGHPPVETPQRETRP